MSEDQLQTADLGITIEGDEPVSVEPDLSTGAELATASPDEGEVNTEDANPLEGLNEQQIEAVKILSQKGINKQHFKFREQERRANEYEAKLKVLEESDASSVQKAEAVTIPSVPDSWDDDYAEKMRLRDEAIKQSMRVESQQSARTAVSDQAQLLKQQQEADRSQKLSEQFAANATKLNVSQSVLDAAQQTVINYGITPGLATELLEDAEGPLMVQHLAANPLDLEALLTASPYAAGRMLAEVKVKAAALKPKTSAAPDPATALSGRGAPKSDRGPDGAIFE